MVVVQQSGILGDRFWSRAGGLCRLELSFAQSRISHELMSYLQGIVVANGGYSGADELPRLPRSDGFSSNKLWGSPPLRNLIILTLKLMDVRWHLELSETDVNSTAKRLIAVVNGFAP